MKAAKQAPRLRRGHHQIDDETLRWLEDRASAMVATAVAIRREVSLLLDPTHRHDEGWILGEENASPRDRRKMARPAPRKRKRR